MKGYSFLVIFILIFMFGTSVDAQRRYSQSRVQGGNVVTDYSYDYLPGQADRGRPYRDDKGRIQYEREPTSRSYAVGGPYGHSNYVFERKGKPYREDGKIKYDTEYTVRPGAYSSRYHQRYYDARGPYPYEQERSGSRYDDRSSRYDDRSSRYDDYRR